MYDKKKSFSSKYFKIILLILEYFVICFFFVKQSTRQADSEYVLNQGVGFKVFSENLYNVNF